MICILVRATYYWLVSQNKYLNKLILFLPKKKKNKFILLYKYNSDNKWTYDIRSSDEFLVNSHLRTSLHSLSYFLINFLFILKMRYFPTYSTEDVLVPFYVIIN